MRVYLDNNVVVSIEQRKLAVADIQQLVQDPKPTFYYSTAHIFEIEHYKGINENSKQAFLQKRFNTIRQIFENNYLSVRYPGNNLIEALEDPEIVYKTISDVPVGISAIRNFVDFISPETKAQYRQDMGIDSLKINNYSKSEIIGHLNILLKADALGLSFVQMIERAADFFPNGESFSLTHRFAAMFQLLDMLGYWKDKVTDTSNYARLWDSQHAFYASACDYFICDDKRTRYKTAVAYDIYKIKTKLSSSSGEIFS